MTLALFSRRAACSSNRRAPFSRRFAISMSFSPAVLRVRSIRARADFAFLVTLRAGF